MATATDRTTLDHGYSGGAVGVTAAAGTLMVVTGLLHFFQGLIALFNDEFYVATPEYLFRFDLTTWGWVHLVAGVLVVLAGVALFSGAVWARVVAVVMASLSIIASFAWMPYYPFWSMVLIAFDVFVIWAVTVHGRDIAAR